MSVLSLGKVDKGATPSDKSTFLAPYHASLDESLKKKLQFRDEGNSAWCDFVEVEGTTIRDLQQFLKNTGFMPKANVDGVFGYATQAAVRLFQEYIRTIEGDSRIGTPDGVVGPNTWSYVEKWKKEKAGTDKFVCEWGRSSTQNPSAEFLQWLMLLGKAKAHYQAEPNPILQLIDNYSQATDTRKLQDWDTRPETIHLIGIRQNQEIGSQKRENDDLFILLIKGMVFKFWGSTDPNPDVSERSEIPFLIEGQHIYKFGWHKVSDEVKVYRALRPASNGVLVFRDRTGDRALKDEDILEGLDKKPNTTINIHWSGMGGYNFSAGCQVMAGRSYINNRGDLVDCSGFAAGSYSDLGSKKTRGAYNVFADLVLTYAPPGVQTLAYTLGRDETLFLSDKEADYVKKEVNRMSGRGINVRT
jgi:hypothetical protein